MCFKRVWKRRATRGSVGIIGTRTAGSVARCRKDSYFCMMIRDRGIPCIHMEGSANTSGVVEANTFIIDDLASCTMGFCFFSHART